MRIGRHLDWLVSLFSIRFISSSLRLRRCVPFTMLSLGRGLPSARGFRARVVTSWPIGLSEMRRDLGREVSAYLATEAHR
jgi:hypothetical protein